MSPKILALAGALTFTTLSCTTVEDAPDAQSQEAPIANEEPAVIEAAEAFGRAIASHDSTLAASLLSESVLILEGAAPESRDEYLSHHFHSDAAFIGSVERESVSRTVTVVGDVAWIASVSRLHGSYRDREIDLRSLETLVLRKESDQWRIASVHWSSRPNS